MKKALILIFYISAFFMPWGEGMQHVFSKASTVFPICCALIIFICLFFKIHLFTRLPKSFKIFVYFLLFHTFLFIFFNPELLTFGTVDVVERGNGFSIGKTSMGDSIMKLVLFILYGCFLTKCLSNKIISVLKYSLFYAAGFSATILLGGFSNDYGGTLRISGGLSDPNAMAVDALVAFSLSWFIFKEAYNKKIYRYIGLTNSAIACYAILMSFSRGAMIALVVMLFIYMSRRYNVMKMAFALIAVAVIVYMGYEVFTPSDIKDTLQMRFSLKEIKESGGAGRTDIWIAYLLRWPYYFVTGTGYDNCNSVLINHREGLTISLNYVTHNQYLLYFVEQGIIGAILYISYIIFGFKLIHRISGANLCLVLPFIGYAFATFFVNLSNGRTLWLIFALVNYIYLLNKLGYENFSIRTIK